MKKINLFVVIVLAMLFTGCAFNKTPFQAYPVMTEIQLNQANYRIVGEVHGYSRQVYVFGIGGLSKKSLKENAIMDMYENANLSGSQAIINITTAFSVSSVLGVFYTSKRAVARGTIIEFLQENGQPIKSLNSPYNTVSQRTMKKEETEERKQLSLEEQQELSEDLQESANKYYIAWLIRTGNVTEDKNKLTKLSKLYSTIEITKLAREHTSEGLKMLSEGHDKDLEVFAK